MEPLRIQIKPKYLAVPIEKADGTTEDFELREMSAGVRDKYFNEMNTKFETDEDGKKTVIKNYEGLRTLLVSNCLYRKTSNKQVPHIEVQSWPPDAWI